MTAFNLGSESIAHGSAHLVSRRTARSNEERPDTPMFLERGNVVISTNTGGHRGTRTPDIFLVREAL